MMAEEEAPMVASGAGRDLAMRLPRSWFRRVSQSCQKIVSKSHDESKPTLQTIPDVAEDVSGAGVIVVPEWAALGARKLRYRFH